MYLQTVAPSTRQQCNLVTCDITSDLVHYVLARWHAKRTPVIHLPFAVVYKLAYSRWICTIIIIITVYQWIFVLAMGQSIKFPTYYTK